MLTIANFALSYYVSKIATAIDRLLRMKTEAGFALGGMLTFLLLFIFLEIGIHIFCSTRRND